MRYQPLNNGQRSTEDGALTGWRKECHGAARVSRPTIGIRLSNLQTLVSLEQKHIQVTTGP